MITSGFVQAMGELPYVRTNQVRVQANSCVVRVFIDTDTAAGTAGTYIYLMEECGISEPEAEANIWPVNETDHLRNVGSLNNVNPILTMNYAIWIAPTKDASNTYVYRTFDLDAAVNQNDPLDLASRAHNLYIKSAF